MNVPVYLNNVINPQELIISNLDENELISLQVFYKAFTFTTNTITSFENYNRFIDFVNEIDLWIQNVKNLNKLMRTIENIEQIKSIILNEIEKYYNNKYYNNFNNYNQSIYNAQKKINKIFFILNNFNSAKEVFIFFHQSDINEFIQILEKNSEEFLCEYVYNNFIKKKNE